MSPVTRPPSCRQPHLLSHTHSSYTQLCQLWTLTTTSTATAAVRSHLDFDLAPGWWRHVAGWEGIAGVRGQGWEGIVGWSRGLCIKHKTTIIFLVFHLFIMGHKNMTEVKVWDVKGERSWLLGQGPQRPRRVLQPSAPWHHHSAVVVLAMLTTTHTWALRQVGSKSTVLKDSRLVVV